MAAAPGDDEGVCCLTEVFPEDSGNYTMTVKNQWGNASCCARVNITMVIIAAAPGDDEGVCCLTEVFPEDSGNYTMTVKNQWGNASSMASLQVKGMSCLNLNL